MFKLFLFLKLFNIRIMRYKIGQKTRPNKNALICFDIFCKQAIWHIYISSQLLISSFQMKKKIAVNKLCQSRIVAFVIQNGCLKASILYQKFLFDFILSCLRLPLYSNSSFKTTTKIDWIYLLQVSPICVCVILGTDDG